MLNLNLGAGGRDFPGYISVDISGAAVNHDLGTFPWPFETEAARHIVASHVLEHFDRETGVLFLTECRRILAPGGLLSIAVPDLDKFIDAINTGDYAPLQGYRWTNLNTLAGGGALEPRPEWRHRYIYGWHSLAHTLLEMGYTHIRRRDVLADWDTPEYLAISLYVDARK